MNRNVWLSLIAVFFISASCFAQSNNMGQIEIEYKDPIKVLGLENDDLYFYHPVQVKYNPIDQKLYVVDKNNHRIVVLDEELNYITEFGRLGQGPGEFERPSGIDFDHGNNLVITDNYNHRIQILDQHFQCLSHQMHQ